MAGQLRLVMDRHKGIFQESQNEMAETPFRFVNVPILSIKKKDRPSKSMGDPFSYLAWLAADLVQHFAVISHILNQILHHKVLHNIITSGNVCSRFLQSADAGDQLAIVLHGLHNILLHRHSKYPPKMSEKCFSISSPRGRAFRRTQTWTWPDS